MHRYNHLQQLQRQTSGPFIPVTIHDEEPFANQPKVCKNFQMYPFQLQSLHRMKALEANSRVVTNYPPVVVYDPNDVHKTPNQPHQHVLQEFESRVGILANKPGSGKSAIVLSLCAEPCSTKNDIQIEKRNGFSVRVYGTRHFNTIVEVKANLIVSNPKLLLQWAGYMKDFDYSSYVITNVSKVPSTLQGMIDLCNQHTVIFISSGALKHIRLYTDKIRFDRIFFDEIDSMDFPQCTGMEIFANYMWWVTATPTSFIQEYRATKKDASTLESSIPQNFKEYVQMATNFKHKEFREHFIVKCDDEEIDACIQLPPYTIMDVKIPRSAAMRLTQGIIEDGRIQHLLRGDRIAQVINILNVSPNEQSVSTLAEAATTWMNVKIGNLRLELEYVMNSVPISTEQAERNQRKVEELTVEITRQEQKKVLLLERIANFTDCMICCDELTNPIGTKCCGQAYCLLCIKSWLGVRSTCPNCRASIRERKDLLVKDDVHEQEKIESSEQLAAATLERKESRSNKKSSSNSKATKKRKAGEISSVSCTASTTSCNAIATASSTRPTTKLAALMQILETSNKMLIYIESLGDDSSERIKTALEARGVEVLSMFGLTSAGSMKVIEKLRDAQPDRKACLIVSSIQHSAGFNLQFVDTIVMYQRMGDRESQIIGRGMRPGRTEPLKVYRILYETE